jgi:hypothetical protein
MNSFLFSVAAQPTPSSSGTIVLALACIFVLSTLALVGAIGIRQRIDKIDADPQQKR